MIPSTFFKRSEFACKCGCGFDTIDAELLVALNYIRLHFKSPVTINSGCRCVEHNKKEGGSSTSKHLIGQATDIRVKRVSADKVADFLEKSYDGRYGIGRYKGRTHIDVRETCARWDKR